MQQRQQLAQDAVKIASWIQVDEMRTLLEIHYDQAFFVCLSSFSVSLSCAIPLPIRPHIRNRSHPTKNQVHLQRYLALGKSGQKRRTSEYIVFRSVAQSYRMKLCQRIELPESIKSIFTCPAHETKLDRLEEARLAIARIIQGEREIVIESEADTEALISSLQRCSSVYPDELCGSSRTAPE